MWKDYIDWKYQLDPLEILGEVYKSICLPVEVGYKNKQGIELFL